MRAVEMGDVAEETWRTAPPFINAPDRGRLAYDLGLSLREAADAGWRVLRFPYCDETWQSDALYAANRQTLEEMAEAAQEDEDHGDDCPYCHEITVDLWLFRSDDGEAPDCEVFRQLAEAYAALGEYPCLDESLWSEIQWGRAEESWCEWGAKEYLGGCVEAAGCDRHGSLSYFLDSYAVDHPWECWALLKGMEDAGTFADSQGRRFYSTGIEEDCFRFPTLSRDALTYFTRAARRHIRTINHTANRPRTEEN